MVIESTDESILTEFFEDGLRPGEVELVLRAMDKDSAGVEELTFNVFDFLVDRNSRIITLHDVLDVDRPGCTIAFERFKRLAGHGYVPDAGCVALVGALCYQFPFLLETLRDHVMDYEEILPHPLLSDVVRYLSEAPVGEAEVRAVWDWLGRAYTRGSALQRNLIDVSGVAAIPNPGCTGAKMRGMLGPELALLDPWANHVGEGVVTDEEES